MVQSADRIVDAAIALAEERGWENVRLYLIAERLGIGLDEIGRQFRDLDAIANAWFGRARRQLLRLPVGLAAQPLESRYGFHLVEVEQRIEGRQLPYEAVAEAIRAELDQRVWQVAVAQYLRYLVGAADIQGIHLEGAETPLMQ